MGLILLDTGGTGTPQAISANIDGTSSVTADLAVLHTLAATETGASTVTAAFTVFKEMVATPTGVCTVTANLTNSSAFGGVIDGSCSVTADLGVLKRLVGTTSAGVCTVSASLGSNAIVGSVCTGVATVAANLNVLYGFVASSLGNADASVNLRVHHSLETTITGLGTASVVNSATQLGFAATVTGTSTVTASLGKTFLLSSLSNLGIVAEYQRLIGILMLIHPDYQTELSTVPTQQTFAVVKKIVKGLFYVDLSGGGTVVSGQVKSGDGINHAQVVNVTVRTISDVPATMTVATGTALAGSGTNTLWLQTNSSGAFQINLSGTGQVLIESIPKQGVVMSTSLTL